MPRAIVFDYGGTLDGEGWHWFDRTLHLYRAAGSDLPEASIKHAFYFADREIAGEAAARGYRLRPLIERHVELQIAMLGDGARDLAGKIVAGFCRMTEEGWLRSRQALERLRHGARLGVVSNFYGNLEVLLEEAGILPLLDCVIESTRVGIEKPDPRIYRLAAERLDLDARDVVMVGDNFERDIRPAKRIGMGTVWLRRGKATPPEPGIADRVVSSLSEIA
ncbi:MAG: HAD family hydrolase [Candidatus Binatia bacterium]